MLLSFLSLNRVARKREREREPFDHAATGKVSRDTNFHLGPAARARFANAAMPSIHPSNPSIALPHRPERDNFPPLKVGKL